VHWYNEEHRHSAIGFVTPAQRHARLDAALLAKRVELYEAARARHPERWSGATRNWQPVTIVHLNPEKPATKKNSPTGAKPGAKKDRINATFRRQRDRAVAALATLKIAHVALRDSSIPVDAMKILEGLGERQGLTNVMSAIDALKQNQAADALSDWLVAQGVEKPWLLAPCLVSAGILQEELDPLAVALNREQFAAAIHWLASTLELNALMEVIRVGSVRISGIIRAMKSYSHLDQSPQQEVDIHEGIEDTFIIMQHRLKQGVTVHREYDHSLPHLSVYGSELNQVWTNLIDNAIDAMSGKGDIVVRTYREMDEAVVEFTDNGTGIADDVMPHLFEPFFSTKPPGQGTGLGLDISYQTVGNRHRGALLVSSRPGQTTFQVRLPLVSRPG
jgi:signal transduction histidine kinase